MKQTYREYAEALFMLASEEDKCDEISAALKQIESVINENPKYLDLLDSPAIPLSERLSLISEAFSGSEEYVVSFLKLLCENGHIRSFSLCKDEFQALLEIHQGKIEAKVYCAVQLTSEQKTALCKKLSKVTGKDVFASYIIDESLIGGIRVEIDGNVYDGSISSALKSVKDVISNE